VRIRKWARSRQWLAAPPSLIEFLLVHALFAAPVNAERDDCPSFVIVLSDSCLGALP